MSKEWHKKALELHHTTDLSWRKIAKELGVPKSTVSDYLRKATKEGYLDDVNTKPKILLFDIETSMIVGYVWGMFKQNLSLAQIKEDWYTICWSAQWLGEEEILNDSVHLHGKAPFRNHEEIVVRNLWKLLDEADVVVAYNGKKFDRKKINTKFLEYGLNEPSPYKVVDPMLIIKGNFAMTSNKMDWVARYTQDLEHKDATNIQLWIDCMEGSVEASEYMLKYCDQDIAVLKNVYLAVRGWDKTSPNLALYYDDNTPRCNSCGSDDLTSLPDASATTSVSKFSVVRCNGCGKILRDRENVLTKEKRKSLYMNVR